MNKFEEEIIRLNKERDEKLAEIQEKIDRLMAQNANMNQLRRLNQAQILDLDGEKCRIGQDYTRRKGEILMRQHEWFAENPSNNTLRKKNARVLQAAPRHLATLEVLQCRRGRRCGMKTLVIFRDCHSKNNIVTTAANDREEERIRLRAMSKGYLVAVRKPKQPGCETHCTTMPTNRTWRKPAAIAERPRTRLGGAFNLTLTSLPKGGEL